MKALRKLGVAGTVIVLGISAFGAGRAVVKAGGPPSPPSPPPWVRADGTTDLSKLPACFVRVGPDGNPVRDSSGQLVCVPAMEIFRSPPPGPGPEDQRVPSVPRPFPGPAAQPVPPVPRP